MGVKKKKPIICVIYKADLSNLQVACYRKLIYRYYYKIRQDKCVIKAVNTHMHHANQQAAGPKLAHSGTQDLPPFTNY